MGRDSKNLDVYADPTGREDEKRKALSPVADAMEAVLQKEKPLKEHPNRGLRAKIIQEMGGDDRAEERYTAAFKKAGLGELPNDRARVARVADLWPQRFDRENKGAGNEIIVLQEGDGVRERPAPKAKAAPKAAPKAAAAEERPASMAGSSSDRPSGAPPADGFGGLIEEFDRASALPRLAAGPRRPRR